MHRSAAAATVAAYCGAAAAGAGGCSPNGLCSGAAHRRAQLLTQWDSGTAAAVVAAVLNETKATRSIPPGPATTVEASFWVYGIGAPEYKDGTFPVQVEERYFWRDPRLTWNPADYGGQASVRIPWIYIDMRKEIWTPPVSYRHVRTYRHIDGNSELFSDGQVIMYRLVDFDVQCKLDWSHYPFDRHECPMHVWCDSYTSVGPSPTLEVIPRNHYHHNTETDEEFDNPIGVDWDAVSSTVGEYNIFQPTAQPANLTHHHKSAATAVGNSSQRIWFAVEYTFKFRRVVWPHIWHTFVPMWIILFLSWAGLFLDPEAVPARVAMSATSVLTFVSLMFTLTRHLPRIGYTLSLEVYLIIMLYILVLNAVEFAIVNHLFTQLRVRSQTLKEDAAVLEAACSVAAGSRRGSVMPRREKTGTGPPSPRISPSPRANFPTRKVAPMQGKAVKSIPARPPALNTRNWTTPSSNLMPQASDQNRPGGQGTPTNRPLPSTYSLPDAPDEVERGDGADTERGDGAGREPAALDTTPSATPSEAQGKPLYWGSRASLASAATIPAEQDQENRSPAKQDVLQSIISVPLVLVAPSEPDAARAGQAGPKGERFDLENPRNAPLPTPTNHRAAAAEKNRHHTRGYMAARREDMLEMFNAMDHERNGVIPVPMLRSYLQRAGMEREEAIFAASGADLNNDGFINQKEWVTMLMAAEWRQDQMPMSIAICNFVAVSPGKLRRWENTYRWTVVPACFFVLNVTWFVATAVTAATS